MTEPTVASEVPRYRFPRAKRLHGRSTFIELRTRGKRKYSMHFGIRYLPTDFPVQVGFAIGKKCGNAVVRNRIRRLLREFIRQNWSDLPLQGQLLCTVQRPFTVWSDELTHEFRQLMRSIG